MNFRKTNPEPQALADDFVVVGNGIPFRPKQSGDSPGLEIHQLPDEHGLLLSFKPSVIPDAEIPHVPVDITLVIDVSGSMQSAAPLPDTQNAEERESAGLSILDLTKHAARTILASLNEKDRLAIVTFSTEAMIVQQLTHVTNSNRSIFEAKIDALHHQSATNLWGGIKSGLTTFEKASTTNNVQGMFVLTDGMPNHMCPPQGYVTKLKPILANIPSPPTIHTFGFGYSMRSDLMQSIAEVGNGNYAFIPDAGMIGTIFVHAMANLFSTFFSGAELEIQGADAGDLRCSTVFNIKRPNPNTAILQLGNVQYGQSRDLLITSADKETQMSITSATLKYRACHASESYTNTPVMQAVRADDMSPALIEYHTLRSEICSFLEGFVPIGENGEHSAIFESTPSFEEAYSRLDTLAKRITNSPHMDDPNVQSLFNDLTAADSSGQIFQALQTKKPTAFYSRWGRHYLPSLLHAHARQVCNSFKDPGPLRYGIDSPLFIKCRDSMDATFENMPPPKPSRPPQMRGDGSFVPHLNISMARYHSSSNPCFQGECEVQMGDGTVLAVGDLQIGMKIWSPMGGREVVAVVKTEPMAGSKDDICRVGELWVTPYHPINVAGQWVFPAEVAEEVKRSESSVYSVLLEYSNDPRAHAIEVGGQLAVTLGHGVQEVTEPADARAHAFFGNYIEVARSLMNLERDEDGRLMSAGVARCAETGLVCGFKATTPSEILRVRDLRCCADGVVQVGAAREGELCEVLE